MPLYMFSCPHGEKIIFLNFSGFGTQLEGGQNTISTVALTWPNKLKGDPNKRSKNKYCHFQQDHGHDTSKCYDHK